MNTRGLLIVFEGPDGTGKSSIIHGLLEKFAENSINWEVFAFPGNNDGTLGKHIYELHHNPLKFNVQEIFPESLQILHIATHIEAIETKILPLLLSGKNVLLDRYWWSTWVYGVLNGVNEQALEKIIELENCHWTTYLPDLLILVDRLQSFKNEYSEDEWHRLQELYRLLFEKEKTKYPIHLITNNGYLMEAVEYVNNLIQCIIKKNGL